MKTKLLGGVLIIMVTLSGSTSIVNATNEQVYAKSAPSTAEAIQPIVKVTKVEKPKKKICKNWLVKHLHESGFRGKNLREAWAIVMRESGGNEKTISSTNDYGMFQFNHYAHHKSSWWDSKKLLTRDYNTKIAYEKSRGGKTWYMWDIDGQGNWKADWSPRSTYDKYVSWYNKYPCK
jgi:hypothetical protein